MFEKHYYTTYDIKQQTEIKEILQMNFFTTEYIFSISQ